MSRLSKMLRLYLAAENIEQQTVAAACGISTSSLSRFLGGDRTLDTGAFVRLLAWCTDDAGKPRAEPHRFNPDARIDGPDAAYRKEPK